MELQYQILFKHTGILKYSETYRTQIRVQNYDILEQVMPKGQVYTYSLKFNGYAWWVKCSENHLTMLRLKSELPFTVIGEQTNVL